MPSMSDSTPAAPAPPATPAVPVPAGSLPVLAPSALPSAERVVLVEAAPGIEELFRFAREAELRVSSLRMTIEERLENARGPELHRHEIWLRHPGQARVTTYRDAAMPSRDYDVWLLSEGTVTTYLAARKVASRRPLARHVVGVDGTDLPAFARQREPLTALPSGSLADTFVHPHGLFRNVLVTGPLAVAGTRLIGGREAIIVRSEHPRASKVLVDRPDRSIEVGIDRQLGLLLLLRETIADHVTRHAEITDLAADPPMPPSAFELRLPADIRMLY
jgi:hypothetical protein